MEQETQEPSSTFTLDKDTTVVKVILKKSITHKTQE